MKRLLVFSIILVAADCQKPIITPIRSIYPCENQQDVAVWFEPGLQQKDNNRYYVYVNKVFPADCKIKVNFNSEVNITLIVQTRNNKYMRMVIPEGDTFSINLSNQYAGLGFIVTGTEPGVTPYLLNFLANDVELCNNPISGYLDQFAADTDITDTCGRRIVDYNELILPGTTIRPGDWPWHAAIYRLDSSTKKYICDGTLLSKKAVLTAAYCATYRGTEYPSEELTVVLGKYTLTEDDKESVEKGVQKIIVHEHFNYRHLLNDIALLILKTEVTFNDFIQPACLWYRGLERTLKSQPIYGTVVGWRSDTTDTLSSTLQKVTLPIVSETTCLRSNIMFYSRALNDFNFCAGYQNRTSVGLGISGSAFQVFVPDEIQIGTKLSGTWHVKGIYSTTIYRHDVPIFDSNQYGVFTDVEKYIDWIKTNWED